jgi:hypothetical protein
MKSFDRADDAFIQAAVDDARRPELIRNTSCRRTKMFWGAMIISACALGIFFIEATGKTHSPELTGTMFFVAAMNWMQVFKCESDLRLLKLVDKLKK